MTGAIVEFDIIDDPATDFEYPSYSDPGHVIFDRLPCDDDLPFSYLADIDIVDADTGSCVFYMQEGAGISFWLDTLLELANLRIGRYVLTGITGRYIRGTWGFEDDDEEFEYEQLIPIAGDKETWP